MQQRSITLAIAAVAIVGVACSESKTAAVIVAPVSKVITFRAIMNGASETPVNASPGLGLFAATLDTSTNVFTYDVTFSNLTSAVNNRHIHGPASTTANAGTTINFNTWPGATFSFGQTSGTAHGTATLNASTAITATINGDSLKKILIAGLAYANIHTTQIPGGEIRGQIVQVQTAR